RNAGESGCSPSCRWRSAAGCRACHRGRWQGPARSWLAPPSWTGGVQAGQVGQLVANLQFQAARYRLVVAARLQFLGEVVLAGGVGIRLVVGIAVFLAVAQLLH